MRVATALIADTVSPFKIDYARSASAYGTAITNPTGTDPIYDSVKIGTDGLAILSSTTTNAVALSATQLKYDLLLQRHRHRWHHVLGRPGHRWHLAHGHQAAAPAGGIRYPDLVPADDQRWHRTGARHHCGIANVEENDPEAIDASGASADAIEPMSSGRLGMFLGKPR